MNFLVSSKEKAEEHIKADKMIHVGVCYKDMTDLQKIPGRQSR